MCSKALRALGVHGDLASLDQLHTFMDGLIAQMMLRGPDRSASWAAGALEEELRRYGG